MYYHVTDAVQTWRTNVQACRARNPLNLFGRSSQIHSFCH